jgi:hypothetical protein
MYTYSIGIKFQYDPESNICLVVGVVVVLK